MKERDLKMKCDNTDLYRELKFFCRQYDRKKREANNLLGLKAVNNESIGGSSGISNPTEKSALLRERYLADCDIIEQCCKEATSECGINYKPLLASVTKGTPYKSLDFFCGINQFTELRRVFFNLLAIKLGKM